VEKRGSSGSCSTSGGLNGYPQFVAMGDVEGNGAFDANQHLVERVAMLSVMCSRAHLTMSEAPGPRRQKRRQRVIRGP